MNAVEQGGATARTTVQTTAQATAQTTAQATAERLLDACGAQPAPTDAGQAAAVAWALKDLCHACWSTDPARVGRAADACAALAAGRFERPHEALAAQEIAALVHWTRAIAHITGGRMADAIDSFDAAAAVFTALGQAGHAAQTQVPKIMALAMLGRYAQAASCADRAQRQFVAAGDVRAAGRVSLNLGALHVQSGDYARAARHSREAAVLFARVGDHEHSVMADINMADALTSLGDFDEALRIFARAHMRAGTHGFPVLEALADESVALLQLARGRYDEALRGFDSARRRYESLAMAQPQAVAEKQLGDTYLELRMLPEALALYEGAAAHFEALGIGGELAATLSQLGRLHAMQARQDLATAAFERAAALYAGQGHGVGQAGVTLSRAELALDAHRPQQAELLAAQAAQAFEVAGLPAQLLRARGVLALAQLAGGAAAAARAGLQATLDGARSLQLLSVQVRCLTGLGRAAQALGDTDQARVSFQDAVDLFEAQRRALPGDELRHAFLADHLRPYQELLRLALADHDQAPLPAQAAQVLVRLDQFRARALAERLATGPEQVDDPATQALRERLNWLYRQEHKLADEGEPSAALTQEARCVETALLEGARRARWAQPAGAQGGAADRGVDVHALQQALGEHDALVEYGVLDNELFACVVTPAQISVCRHAARWNEVVEALRAARFQLDTLNRGSAHMQAHLPTLTRRTQLRLARLHALVWAPLQALLQSSRRVLVVPHGPLGDLPFAALHDGSRYLMQRWQIASAPSARLALHQLQRSQRAPQAVLAIGDSHRLAHAGDEARAVAALFASGRVCVGEHASVDALRLHGGAADIIHLACHARFRSDNPSFSALQLHDAALSAELAEGLALQGQLVVLSACETGLSEQRQGDEQVGLVRAFLVAGAARVLASLWSVDDRVTAEFMSSFYIALRSGAGTAGALAQAQLDTLQRHPHPCYWAGFALHGGW